MNLIGPNKKTAIVLFNLGGPDNPEAVRPFLFNLFNDAAIIALPRPFRYLLARLISKKRAPTAQKIYDEMGGKSPILENTQAQAQALETSLGAHGKVKTFIAMRYWHPRAAETVREVKAFAPDEIILLPLYPQFSATTTGSSLKEWHEAARAENLNVPTHAVGCYFTHPEFIRAHAQLIRTYYAEAAQFGTPRILFSAHGLPEKNIAAGDPYQWQIEQSTQAILAELAMPGVDAVNCYQSRVGPLKWIGPSTPEEITRAARDGVPIVLVPIAFVSEHSETLVELDIEYAELAHKHGVDRYYRVPTLSTQPHFIAALADICLKLTGRTPVTSHEGKRLCDKKWGKCVCT
ncbi:MAG: ferrochelatase [Rickettsiales bacterium]